MSSRRTTLAGRLIARAVDVVSDRAPWLSDQAYRAVAAPLQRMDPAGGARAAETRLDSIRDRVVTMAADGRVRRTEQRRIDRDLARTWDDLQRITPRLPAVQAHGLALRLAAYAEVLAGFPGRPAVSRPPVRARDAIVLTGAAGAWTGAFLPLASPTMAVGGGLAAGAVTTLGSATVRNRRALKAQIGALAEALAEVDRTAGCPNGVSPQDLDQARRTLLRRVRDSGRLDARGLDTLHRIDVHLGTLLIRLVQGDLEADAAHLVQATITRYLPDTLEPLLALPDPAAVVRGRPIAVEVADQLASIEGGLAGAARRPWRNDPEALLRLQGEFLRSKFGEPSGKG